MFWASLSGDGSASCVAELPALTASVDALLAREGLTAIVLGELSASCSTGLLIASDIMSFEMWEDGELVGWTTNNCVATEETVMVEDGGSSCVISSDPYTWGSVEYTANEVPASSPVTVQISAAVFNDTWGIGDLVAVLKVFYMVGETVYLLGTDSTTSTSWDTLTVNATSPAFPTVIYVSAGIDNNTESTDSVIFDNLRIPSNPSVAGATLLALTPAVTANLIRRAAGTPSASVLAAAGVAGGIVVIVSSGSDTWNPGLGYYSAQFYLVYRYGGTAQWQVSVWNGTSYGILQAWTNCTISQSYTSADGDAHPTQTAPNRYGYTAEVRDNYRSPVQTRFKCEFRVDGTIVATKYVYW
jgi:hypothetical protein